MPILAVYLYLSSLAFDHFDTYFSEWHFQKCHFQRKFDWFSQWFLKKQFYAKKFFYKFNFDTLKWGIVDRLCQLRSNLLASLM